MSIEDPDEAEEKSKNWKQYITKGSITKDDKRRPSSDTEVHDAHNDDQHNDKPKYIKKGISDIEDEITTKK